MRPSGRAVDVMRPVEVEVGFTKHAEGSCLIKCGDTHVLCTASVEGRTPPWLRNTGLGWVTAEYGMLPTRHRFTEAPRGNAAGKQSGRTQEIQRLIGRSLRAGVDRVAHEASAKSRLIATLLQADGGTQMRGSITGGWVALALGSERTDESGRHHSRPADRPRCGGFLWHLWRPGPYLDLDYAEDSEAGTDANFVMTGAGWSESNFKVPPKAPPLAGQSSINLMDLAEKGVGELVAAQKAAMLHDMRKLTDKENRS